MKKNLAIRHESFSPRKTFGRRVCTAVRSKTKINKLSLNSHLADIVLFNSADVAYSTQRDNYLIDVKQDGSVTWIFPDILRSYCPVDIKFFPFDRYFSTQTVWTHQNATFLESIFKLQAKLYARTSIVVAEQKGNNGRKR